jgi:hypothetical protein
MRFKTIRNKSDETHFHCYGFRTNAPRVGPIPSNRPTVVVARKEKLDARACKGAGSPSPLPDPRAGAPVPSPAGGGPGHFFLLLLLVYTRRFEFVLFSSRITCHSAVITGTIPTSGRQLVRYCLYNVQANS